MFAFKLGPMAVDSGLSMSAHGATLGAVFDEGLVLAAGGGMTAFLNLHQQVPNHIIISQTQIMNQTPGGGGGTQLPPHEHLLHTSGWASQLEYYYCCEQQVTEIER